MSNKNKILETNFDHQAVAEKILFPTPKEHSEAKLLMALMKTNPKKAKAIIMGNLPKSQFQKFLRFLECSAGFNDKEYWYGLRVAYEGSDNLFSLREQVKKSFNSPRSNREYLMTEPEREQLMKLPDKFQIYRGMTVEEYNGKDFGLSWTLSKKVANFFVKGYGRNFDTSAKKKMVHKLTVKKENVIAYLNGRQEQEIIYIHRRDG